jgi:hypothetical protein
MELNRRQMIAGSMSLAAAGMVPVRAADVAVSPQPAIDTKALFAVAKRELERAGRRVWLRDVVGIADYGVHSAQKRFFLLDMVSGTIKPFLVTHGKGSDAEHDGWLKSFSNLDGSLATSRGAYLTNVFYEGKHGLSMRLFGLDADNSNADPRAIVVHAADYAEPAMIDQWGKLGRSEGCFVFPHADLMPVLGRLGPGRLLFADRISVPPPRPEQAPPAPQVPSA